MGVGLHPSDRDGLHEAGQHPLAVKHQARGSGRLARLESLGHVRVALLPAARHMSSPDVVPSTAGGSCGVPVRGVLGNEARLIRGHSRIMAVLQYLDF